MGLDLRQLRGWLRPAALATLLSVVAPYNAPASPPTNTGEDNLHAAGLPHLPAQGEDTPHSALRTPHSVPDSSDLDTTVTYAARDVRFTFNPRRTVLTGDAKVAYRQMELTAGRIEVLWDDKLLTAAGLPDTVARDTTGAGVDSVVWKELPRLKDGDQIVAGERMVYNLDTRRGRVIHGTTRYEDGLTRGRVIKKVDEEVLNIRSGEYTTCDLEHPHYHFWSRDLKLVVKDKVIARPVVLYFGPVPVAIIPFAVFPARGGRHSGLIVPTYGESAAQGRYFQNLGYYWAPSDYLDWRGSLDFYERYGILFRGDLNYAKRYRFTGNLSGSFNNQRREGNRQGYDLVYNHRHSITPTTNLNVRAEYVSSKNYRRELSLNPWERMKNTVRSDATLAKNWRNRPYSATVNLHYEQDLRSGAETRSVPKLSFNRSKSPLIPQPKGAPTDEARWFNQVYWSYSGSAENRRTVAANVRRFQELEDGEWVTREEIDVSPPRYRSGVQHRLTLDATQKPFGYFALNPNLSYSEAWFDEWLEYKLRGDGAVDTLKRDGFRARRTFGAGANLSTKLYGLFHPGVFGVDAVRHTLSPAVSFNYNPDFTEPKWAIYQQFADTVGVMRHYDRFAGALYPSPGRGERMALGLKLDNLFQYKRTRGDKTVKGDLFTLNLATSYNLAADSLRWSDLRSSLRINPLGAARSSGGLFGGVSGLSLQLTGTHSFYDVYTDPVSGFSSVVDHPAPGGLRLVSFDLSASFNITGGRDDTEAARDTTQTPPAGEDRFENPLWQPSPLPWDGRVGLHYGERRGGFGGGSKSIWMSLGLELEATRNWKVGYDTRLDLHNRRVVSSNVSLYRDLHCWEGRFTWTPMGVGQGYYLIISIKSPQLRDVKVEKREGGGGLFGY